MWEPSKAPPTSALATAMTILAPSLAMPPASYLRPTMKPEMFCGSRGLGEGRCVWGGGWGWAVGTAEVVFQCSERDPRSETGFCSRLGGCGVTYFGRPTGESNISIPTAGIEGCQASAVPHDTKAVEQGVKAAEATDAPHSSPAGTVAARPAGCTAAQSGHP